MDTTKAGSGVYNPLSTFRRWRSRIMYHASVIMIPPDFLSIAQTFLTPTVTAIALFGSYARGDAGPYSDVDMVRFVTAEGAADQHEGSHWIEERLVNVSNVTPDEVERWFTEPNLVVNTIGGVRRAKPLFDSDGVFAVIQQRAGAFRWTDELQTRANDWASQQMVGWAEEAYKGLEGLRRNDIGRLLNSRHGGSWGMMGIVQVQRGILVSGDNGVYEEVAAAMADVPEWGRLQRIAFGIEDEAGHTPLLREQVWAGLRLYVLTAKLLAQSLRPEDKPIIEKTAARIRAALSSDRLP